MNKNSNNTVVQAAAKNLVREVLAKIYESPEQGDEITPGESGQIQPEQLDELVANIKKFIDSANTKQAINECMEGLLESFMEDYGADLFGDGMYAVASALKLELKLDEEALRNA